MECNRSVIFCDKNCKYTPKKQATLISLPGIALHLENLGIWATIPRSLKLSRCQKRPIDWQILGTSGTFMPPQDLAISPDPPPDLLYLLPPWKLENLGAVLEKLPDLVVFPDLIGFCTREDVVLPDVTTALATSATCLPDEDLRIYHLEIRSHATGNS